MTLHQERRLRAIRNGALAILLFGGCHALNIHVPAFVTIDQGGVGNHALTIDASNDRQVTFTNRDTVAHGIFSDPHPAHTSCQGLNVGTLAPGQSATTAALPVGTCAFHDDTRPDDASFRATITVR